MTEFRVNQKALSAAQRIDKTRLQELEEAEFFRILKVQQGVVIERGKGGKKRRNRKLPAGCFTPRQLADRYGVKVDNGVAV
jgi:hypothetical protein